MKKKLLALLLALAMLVSCMALMTGCSKDDDDDDNDRRKDKTEQVDDKKGNDDADEDSLVGTWTAEIDMTDAMRAYMEEEAAAGMEELADYIDGDVFDFSRLNAVMEMTMVLKDDGTITLSLNAEDFADSMRDVMKDTQAKMIDALPSIMEASFAQQGMTLEQAEQLLAAQGMSMDDMMDMLADELVSSMDSEIDNQINSMDLSMEENGYYEVEGDKLYTLENKNDPRSEYMVFELKGNTLVVTDMSGDAKEGFAEFEEMGIQILPLTFKRA